MSNFIIHNSHDIKYRMPFGAVPTESKVVLKIEVNTDLPVNSVFMQLISDNGEEKQLDMQLEDKEGENYLYYIEIDIPEVQELLWYYFKLDIDRTIYYYGNNGNAFGGEGNIAHAVPVYYQISVYKKQYETPKWYKKSVMYQIFVDRFNNCYKNGKILNPRSNCLIHGKWDDTPSYLMDEETGGIQKWDFFGGNLQGIINKLDYLNELGVDVLYLNPIFDAPSNHKYDTSDYMKIDQMFGDDKVFRKLCKEADKRNISIILDGVFSHTGCDSKYFNKYGNYCDIGAYQSEQSPYYSWYKFKECRDSYDCWWGIETMPNVEEMDESFREFIINGEDSVIKHWMKMGAKGWRLDVADELPDQFIKEIRTAMKEQDNDSVLIGEVWEDASNKMSYSKRREYLQGEEFDSIMNYPFKNIFIDFLMYRRTSQQASKAFMSIKENYPVHSFYSNMNIIGTHDTPRVLTILADSPNEEHMSIRQKEKYKIDENGMFWGISRLKLISLIQMTFPGIPCVYYGDEAGVEGYGDPLNRRTYPWGQENQEIINWYKQIIGIRKQNSVFATGQYYPIYTEDDVLVYIRYIADKKDVFKAKSKNAFSVVVVNRSEFPRKNIEISLIKWKEILDVYNEKSFIDLLDDSYSISLEGEIINVHLEPLSARILMINGD